MATRGATGGPGLDLLRPVSRQSLVAFLGDRLAADRGQEPRLDLRPGGRRLQLVGDQAQHLRVEARHHLGGLRGLAGGERLVEPALEPLQRGQDGAVLGGELFVHNSSRISERSAPRSFFMASSVRVLTVPSGRPARPAISLWESPS
jgi:hypothetical protein